MPDYKVRDDIQLVFTREELSGFILDLNSAHSQILRAMKNLSETHNGTETFAILNSAQEKINQCVTIINSILT